MIIEPVQQYKMFRTIPMDSSAMLIGRARIQRELSYPTAELMEDEISGALESLKIQQRTVEMLLDTYDNSKDWISYLRYAIWK